MQVNEAGDWTEYDTGMCESLQGAVRWMGMPEAGTVIVDGMYEQQNEQFLDQG